MNTQFKKGVLELVVLLTIAKTDKYGYELVSEVSKIIDVNEGTIYPLLKRLTNDRYLETYLTESTEGPPRKYYHLTKNGEFYMKNLLAEWKKFVKDVNAFIKEEKI
jgi:Predicted transcriptional regulators